MQATEQRLPRTAALQGDRFETPAYWLAALGSLVWIWSSRFVPLQDYPDWLHQARLMAAMLRGELPDAYAWAGAPAPNAICTLVIGALSLVLPIEVAGKLFLSAYAGGFLFAARRLLAHGGAGNGLLLLPLALLFNHALLHGNINYALSLAVFCAASEYVLRERERVSALRLSIYALVLYACHAMTLCAWALLACVVAWQQRREHARALPKVVLALSPALALGLFYTARVARESEIVAGASSLGLQQLGGFVAYKLGTLLQWFSPFAALHPLYEPLRAFMVPLLVLNIACTVVLCWVMGLSLQRSLRAREPIGVVALVLLVAFALAPRALGGLINPGERLLLPAVLLLALAAPALKALRFAPQVLAALFTLQLCYLGAYGSLAAERLERMQVALDEHAAARPFAVITESHFDFGAVPRPSAAPPAWKLLPRHHPFLHHAFTFTGDTRTAPIFETGLFEYRGADRVLSSFVEIELGELPEVLLVVGDPKGSAVIAQRLGGRYVEAASGEGFVLLEAGDTVR
jgi:hypothetical protein